MGQPAANRQGPEAGDYHSLPVGRGRAEVRGREGVFRQRGVPDVTPPPRRLGYGLGFSPKPARESASVRGYCGFFSPGSGVFTSSTSLSQMVAIVVASLARIRRSSATASGVCSLLASQDIS